MHTLLPALLTFVDGTPVRTRDDWARRRAELDKAIVPLQYGGLPPAPARVQAEQLSLHTAARFGDAQHSTWRLTTSDAPMFSFTLDLLVPPGPGPFPTVINGDACWVYATDTVKAEVLRRGNVLAMFNRCEIASDRPDARDTGLYRVHPGATFGALAAWAWGYHRVIDFLTTLPFIDAKRLVVTGHSRGGKATLLAGATDERIAITNPNNSGCGGAGCHRVRGPQCERLGDILKKFPFWFGPDLPAFIGREEELPFDQHFLKALVAPRDLLTTEALGDAWANPAGTHVSHVAAGDAYELLGARDRIGVLYRPGTHAHHPDDWLTLLDYMDFRFRGIEDGRSFARDAINQPPPSIA